MAPTTALTVTPRDFAPPPKTALTNTAPHGTLGTPNTALTAKIAENFAAARATSDVMTNPFWRGAAVLYDNPTDGKLELGHVLAIHVDPSSREIEYYTIKTVQGLERQVEGERPSRRAARSPRRASRFCKMTSARPCMHVLTTAPSRPPSPQVSASHTR